MVDGIQAVVIIGCYGVAGQVQDDQLQQPPKVTHLPYPLDAVAPTVQLHQ